MRMLRGAELVRGLPMAVLTAVIATAGAGEAFAQFSGRGNGFASQRGVISAPQGHHRGPIMDRPGKGPGHAIGLARDPGFGSASPRHPGKGDTFYPPGRRPGGGVVIGETRPPWHGGDRPRRPRPVRPMLPPDVVIGPGVVTGPAVVIGPAIAEPPPPPPPRRPAARPPAPRPSPPAVSAAVTVPPAGEQRFLPDELVLEFASALSDPAIAALLQRHRLVQIDRFTLALTGSTYVRTRIADGRPVRAVLAALGREAALGAGQPNYLYTGTQSSRAAAAAAPGDPAQYALAKLHLQEAHGLTRGDGVLVAVIDSGIDASHPELKDVIAGTFEATGKAVRPHAHGTAMAGTIAARARLSGVAPAARILAVHAFGAAGDTVRANTFAILKGTDHAIRQNARVINMSFAGPSDPGFGRVLANAKALGIVLVAAAGNQSGAVPQYPASDPNVIAVSATDPSDRLYDRSNRGRHIAVAAPGVDILVPVPGANYDLTSGTSVAAAHVSGVAALILARHPTLDPDAVRRIILSSARDLGPAGPDDRYGAGLADAYRALLTAGSPVLAGSTAGH